MPDETQEQKKRGIFRKILPWIIPKKRKEPGVLFYIFICVVLLFWSVLYIAGIIYHIISWIGVTVGGILLVNLALDHILYLAKRKDLIRKHSRISIWAFILLLAFIAFRFFWPDSETWQTYTFDKELAAIEAKRAISDDKNAAILYEPLLAYIDHDVYKPDFFNNEDKCEPSALTGPWKETEHPEFAAWLNSYADVLGNLVTVCQVEQCRFPIQANLLADSPKRYDKLKFCAKLLLSAANRDISGGKIETGLKKYLCVIKMAKHNYQQQTTMDFFVGSDIEAPVLKPICKFIVEKKANNNNLELISKSIDIENNWSTDWPALLDVAKLVDKNICGRLYESNSRGKIRFTRHASAMFDKTPPSNLETNFNGKMAAIIMSLLVPYSPQTVGKVIDDIYEKYYKAAAPDFDWDKLKEYDQYRLSRMHRLHATRILLWFGLTDALILPHVHNLYMRRIASRRGCRILIALRQYKNKHGNWPESLDEISDLLPLEALIDPTNGGAFVYKLTEQNFTLYSKGKNNIDENGKNRCYDKKTEADDILIWPPRNCKTKKENADARRNPGK